MMHRILDRQQTGRQQWQESGWIETKVDEFVPVEWSQMHLPAMMVCWHYHEIVALPPRAVDGVRSTAAIG